MSDSPRITFGEERLKQLFAEFKLELWDLLAKKADQQVVDLLVSRVTHLELWQAAQVATEGTKEKLSARQLGLYMLFATVFVGVVGAVAGLVWSAVIQ